MSVEVLQPRPLRRFVWVLSVYAALLALLLATIGIHPNYDSFDFQTLMLGALPLALAGMGQTVIVVGAGIDLSLGPLMAIGNSLSARIMQHQTTPEACLAAVAVVLIVAVASSLNGLLVILTGIPDIIVTLATSFVWSGVALFILDHPGGGAPSGFQAIATGSALSPWLPNALLLIAGLTLAAWLLLRRTKLGIAVFAIGSNRPAALRSGVNVAAAKVASYSLGGILIGAAGVAMTMSTGVGTPTAGALYTLSSLAVVVLGGVSLTGGRGTLLGPIAGALLLTQLPTDFVFLGVDPNYSQAIQGAILVVVIMLGGLSTARRTRGLA